MKNTHIVAEVIAGSIAEEMGIEAGDRLISINENEIEDVFDYHYYVNDEELLLLVVKPDGEEWELEIEKEAEEDLGLIFAGGLMDEYRSCRNNCMFCFIDQMPPGMRETLYFKDDDARLSFLQGNYITLTNMDMHDIERIIKYRLEPVNISFHTTNPKLRCEMLHNRFAGEALKKVDLLYQNGIHMNGQIVLCKGINDGAELESSIQDMAGYLPYLSSVSVVPVGLTKFRDGLHPLEPFSREDAKEVLSVIRRWQEKLYQQHGTHMIHAGDEWYILAGEELPEAECYDGYQQLENGVGMMRLFVDEVAEELTGHKGDDRRRHIALATGILAESYLKDLIWQIQQKYPNIQVELYAIHNDFFGQRITVSGLITGQDLVHQLSGRKLGSRLLLPVNMLRSGEEVFLDDMTLDEVKETLQVEVDIVKSSGRDFIEAVIR